jgi:hypothetical protein
MNDSQSDPLVGLTILARIIARKIEGNVLDEGEFQDGNKANGNIQNERPVLVGVS